MLAVVTACWLGFLIGLRHALEPDHLAAVSTVVAEHPRPWRAAAVGAFWGLGHSASLLGFGALLLALRVQLPEEWADRFELLVAAMLIALGARSLLRLRRMEHHHHAPARVRRPFAIGAVHGLAGSGAITAVALASMPGPATALVYIALFGLGSIIGMALLTGLAGFPIGRLARSPRAHAALLGSVGALSLAVGVWWGAPLLARLL